MLNLHEYKLTRPNAYHGKAGETHDGMPFAVGDKVIDDNGRIGVISSINCWERRADGSLSNYAVCIRFPWDSDAYGLERIATMGEFALVDADGNVTQDC